MQGFICIFIVNIQYKDEGAKSDGPTAELEPDQEIVNPESGIIIESIESDNKTLETLETNKEINTKTGKGLKIRIKLRKRHPMGIKMTILKILNK